MKTIVFLVVLFVSPFLFAQEKKVCGTVSSFSKLRDERGGRFYEIQFIKGPKISNVVIELGEEALLASSMTMDLKVCFVQNASSEYEFSSGYMYGNAP